jgi:hypothetical protein
VIPRIALALFLSAPLAAEPGVTLLLDSRNPGQARLSAQAKTLLQRLRSANQLEQLELSISTADWADPATAVRWQRDFALTGKELPALAVVRRQGNKVTLDNLLRCYSSPPHAVEGAFRCLQLQSPHLIKQARLRTGLSLTSEPAGAKVLVDGAEAGTTPCLIDLKPGHHRWAVVQENYQSYQRDTTLELGQFASQQIELLPLQAYLRIESSGIPIDFSLDNAPPAPTPALLDVKAGSHHYRAWAPGHYAVEGDVTAPAELLTSLQIGLIPIRLRVALGSFQAEGYTGYTTRSSGSGQYYHTWEEPYQVFIDANPIKEKLRGALGQFDLIDNEPDCVISIQIQSDKDHIQGVATLLDGHGQLRETVSSRRDMPFLSFDEQGSAQKRALEVTDDLLGQILPLLSKFPPQADKAPADRPPQIKVETAPKS